MKNNGFRFYSTEIFFLVGIMIGAFFNSSFKSAIVIFIALVLLRLCYYAIFTNMGDSLDYGLNKIEDLAEGKKFGVFSIFKREINEEATEKEELYDIFCIEFPAVDSMWNHQIYNRYFIYLKRKSSAHLIVGKNYFKKENTLYEVKKD